VSRIVSLAFLLVASATVAFFAVPPTDTHGSWKLRSIVEIEMLDQAVKSFAADNGRLPTQDEGLSALVTRPATDAPNWEPYFKGNRVPSIFGEPRTSTNLSTRGVVNSSSIRQGPTRLMIYKVWTM
jgi:Type II secretion system (T2SS), protein G